jgi:DNA polymerase-3 subunit alpha
MTKKESIMKTADFVHLHVHTHYSLLDSTIRIGDLIKKTREYDMSAVAITDNGNMFGVIEFYKEAKKNGIKPIIGCELYIAPASRFDKHSSAFGETSRPIIVIAENNAGYKNLMKLSSAGYLEGFHHRPRIDKELLARYHEGLIGMSAGLDGEIANLILMDKKDAARKVIAEYKSIFVDGNFYLEISENGLPGQQIVNISLIEFASELGVPLVATNDCHYLNREDAEAHDVLRCVQTGKTLEETKGNNFKTDQLYFRSPAEIQQLFDYCPEAVKNTIAIADRCNVEINFDKFFFPACEYKTDDTPDDSLAKNAAAGLHKLLLIILKRKDDPVLAQQYHQRLKDELEIIKSRGFAGYFFIVADYVQYAKKMNIPVGPCRGSAAGSLVSYALGITNVDPIRYGLLFERFLNPNSKTMPDIDIDFSEEGREEIVRYVTSKYGKEKVAQIITFGKMQARGTIRDVGRAMNIPDKKISTIAEMVPIYNYSIEEAIKMDPRLQEKEKNNPKIKKLLDVSRVLFGLNRYACTHAAGIIISDIPMVEHMPLCKSHQDDDSIVIQYSVDDLQAVGLSKCYFLGLKTLTVIKDTLMFIKKEKGIDVAINNLPLDDEPTYQLLSRGDTEGVFQLGSADIKNFLVSMKPDCIEDVIALSASFRPRAMKLIDAFIARKQGKTKIIYEVPALKEILKETYGLILYQEQVMQLACVIGKYTMAEADTLLMALSENKPAEVENEKLKFLHGAKANKISEHKAQKIWNEMVNFAKYGFSPKAHSTAYAIISYQTAFLKAHYTSEFMAAQYLHKRIL